MKSTNFQKYFDKDGNVKEQILDSNIWLRFLTQTDNVYVNAERVESISEISGRETLLYVFRTLDILDGIEADSKTDVKAFKPIVEEVLKWSEVSKGGLAKEREEWSQKGYPLGIHNIASANIYKDTVDNYNEVVYDIIKSHGLIGQAIRGEIPVSHNAILSELSNKEEMKNINVYDMLMVLNECIIRGVSDVIWNDVKSDVSTLITRILNGDLSEFSTKYRLEKLAPNEIDIFDEDADYFEKNVFSKYELWYFESALSDFDMGQIRKIVSKVLNEISNKDADHINFKPLAESLFYDYEGHKCINVYKKRIIEKYLIDESIQNVCIQVEVINKTAFVDFKFSKVCEKLIDFCVEAERCGLLTFEKSIIVLYDMFGFRRDAFDRLNNENKYLQTMNNVSKSTKDGIIDYAVGNVIVDVGSGGGILLDRLEQKYPNKKIIGTDISTNVIDTLNLKKAKEGHCWNVIKHNFVEGKLNDNADSIIFSSILHEIYSYTESENGCFDIESVKNSLRFAFESLNKGGRIIIRDGIKTDSREIRMLKFKSQSGMDFFKNYVKDFKGLKDIPDEEKVLMVDVEKLVVKGDINFIREFLFTYTWGTESYAHEVKEQFGYFTLDEFKAFFEELGANIIVAKEFLEPGYPDNLNKYVTLLDEDGQEVEYPASNCIVVVEK